jgi:hypothetical protein
MAILVETTEITITHTEVTALASSTAVLSANRDRKYALFVNDSDTTMYLFLGATAELNKGIRLNANGGSYEMTIGQGNVYKGAIKVICSATPKTLLVTEGE